MTFSEQLRELSQKCLRRMVATGNSDPISSLLFRDASERLEAAARLATLWEAWKAADDGSGDINKLQDAETSLLEFHA